MDDIKRLEYELRHLEEDRGNIVTGKIRGSLTPIDHRIAQIKKELAAAEVVTPPADKPQDQVSQAVA